MRIELQKGISQKIVDKALALIQMVEDGLLRPKRLRCNKTARVVEIGRNYRAIITENHDYWFICSHEAYNKLIESGRY